MRLRDLSEALAGLVKAQIPTFLWGPPGVGKSDCVRQVAVMLGMQLCDIRAVLLDPVDLRGIPVVNGDRRAHWCQPEFLPRDGRGILFLDELPNAPASTQSACLQLALDRRIGEYVLPDDWAIVSAGNRQEDRAGSHKLISSLSLRFLHLDVEVNTDDWQTWALGSGISPDVRSFIRFRPSLLHKFDPAARSSPNPRGWSVVSRTVQAVPKQHHLPTITGIVGDGAAAEFIAHRNIYTQLPDVDQVLANPSGATMPTDPSVTYALIGALTEKARNATDKTLRSLATLTERFDVEFASLLVRDTLLINPKFAAPIYNWTRKHQDLFMST